MKKTRYIQYTVAVRGSIWPHICHPPLSTPQTVKKFDHRAQGQVPIFGGYKDQASSQFTHPKVWISALFGPILADVSRESKKKNNYKNNAIFFTE